MNDWTGKIYWMLDSVIAALGGALSWFLGDLDGLIYALLTCTTIDYVTGVAAACIRKELSSSIGFNGIIRKVTIFALVGMAHVLDAQFLSHLGYGEVLRDMVIFFFCSNEGISIAENAEKIGVPFPQILRDKLAQFHNENGTGVKNAKRPRGGDTEKHK